VSGRRPSQAGDQFETTCDDNTRSGRFYKGCGQKITMFHNGVKWNAFTIQGPGQEWIEHSKVCPARKQTTLTPPPQQQEPEPNVAASQPRDVQVLQSDKLIEMQHEIGEIKRDQTSLIWLIQQIAKKLEVGYPKGEQPEPEQGET